VNLGDDSQSDEKSPRSSIQDLGIRKRTSNLRLKTTTLNFVQNFTESKHTLRTSKTYITANFTCRVSFYRERDHMYSKPNIFGIFHSDSGPSFLLARRVMNLQENEI